jgi:DNA adenine methylase
MLSLNDTPEVRETFAAFQIEAVVTTYSIAAAKPATRAGEVLISCSEN